MKLKISRPTFFLKKVLPLIAYSFLTTFLIVLILGTKGVFSKAILVIVHVFMFLFAHFLTKILFGDLVDEVYDEGEALLIKHKGKGIHVNIKDIVGISYPGIWQPNRMIFFFRNQTDLGLEVSFSPRMSMIPNIVHKDIKKLISRINEVQG